MGGVIDGPLLLAGGGALAMWLIVTGLAGGRIDSRHRRQQLLARTRGEAEAPSTPRERRRGAPRIALRRPRSGPLSKIARLLRGAGVEMQPGQFLMIPAVLAGILAIVAGSRFGTPGLLGGGALGLLLPWLWLRQRRGARQAKINEQLNDLLQVVAGGLTAGQSFLQALASAADKVGEPLGMELRLMLNEVELGSTLEDALGRLRERAQDDDLDLAIDAILIQRRVGGNLAEVLTNISWTIRERIRMRGEVKALTGQARLSGWLLSLLPIGLGVALFLMDPEYMSVMVDTSLGRMLLAGGLTAEFIGFLLMRKIANITI
jgi:tight adherence protein B